MSQSSVPVPEDAPPPICLSDETEAPDILSSEAHPVLPEECISTTEHSDNQEDTINNRKLSDKKESHKSGFCYHAGILVFAHYLYLLKKSHLKECENFVIQWLTTILLGAKNIEQSKLLNFQSLDLFLDNPVRNLHQQRIKLKEVATEENINKLLSINSFLVEASKETDFYYDPHTKHYTGLKKILKSWCSKVRTAAEIINTDFIHTSGGFPVYLKNGDTFDDMRVRFFKDVKEFRKIAQISDDQIITMCIDRGIFSTEVLEKVVKTDNLHIVTWEKNYNREMWDEQAKSIRGHLFKFRNNKSDIRLIEYRYQEYKWSKNDKIRQIIVRIPEKNNTGIVELSILTDDLTRDAKQIINLMLTRWVQENDFKYLITHFGIDQITSYLVDNYADISETIADKQHKSGQYKALTKELDKIRGKLKTVLHKKHQFDARFGIYDDISEATKVVDNQLINHLSNEMTKVQVAKSQKKPTSKQIESYKKNISKIIELSNTYQEKVTERSKLEKTVSKVSELMENGTQKLNTAPKQFMDAIKIMARNIFYLAFEKFKEKYDNFRDDHVIFREFTRSDGMIEINDSQMNVEIVTKMKFAPKQRKILNEICSKINEQELSPPNDATKKIRLEISDYTSSFFAFNDN